MALLEDPSEDETSILGALPYQKNTAIIHNDVSLMPKNKLTWSSWNYHLSEDQNRPVALTYNMNILQSLKAKPDFLVTLNSADEIDPSKVIKKVEYHHPLFTVDGLQAPKNHPEFIWYSKKNVSAVVKAVLLSVRRGTKETQENLRDQ